MLFGKAFTAASGPTYATILRPRVETVAGALRAIIEVRREYAERFFAVFINETYLGVFWCDERAMLTVTLPPNYGGGTGSFYIEDVGRFPDFEATDIEYLDWHAKEQGALTSQNLVLNWDAEGLYSVSEVNGSNMSDVEVTGARRGVNVGDVPDMPQRGRLHYSLTQIIGIGTFIRWWAGATLVAEAFDNGSGGAVTCEEINGSGITVDCVFAAGTVERGDGWVDLKWPKEYQIHYSTSALSFPRTPEDTVPDHGDAPYTHTVYELTPGTYNFNVLPVDDEGETIAAPSTPADSPLVVKDVPEPPTITSVSGNAAAGFTFNFTNGEAGCTYTLYMSLKEEPINFGDLSGAPTPVVTALNATSVTSAAIADYAEEDLETAYNTLVTTLASAISTANTAFTAGASGFSTAFATLVTTVNTALQTFSASTRYPLMEKQDQAIERAAPVQSFIDDVGTSLDATLWDTQVGMLYGGYLAFLGAMVDGNSSHWTLPNGALGGSLLGAEAIGSSVDGQIGNEIEVSTTLLEIVTPFVRPARFWAVIRATKSSVEEQNGNIVELELNDATGARISERPNKAQIESIEVDGLDLNVVGGIFDEDAVAAAASLELYVYTGSISLGSPDDVQALPSSGINSYRTVTFDPITVGGAGWYKVAVVALTAAGGRSLLYDEQYVHIDTDEPGPVLNLRGFVARSKGR